MKKCIILSIAFTALTSSYAADLSAYRNVIPVETIVVSQPSIVEIRGLNQTGNYVLTTTQDTVVPQQFQVIRKSKVIPPEEVEACTSTCVSAKALADGDRKTTFDFPLVKSGSQKGTITILYTQPIETDAVVFEVTGDSYLPSAFTLMIDGKRILNTTQGGMAKFPKMMAQRVEIEFEYTQPIRFTEVGVGSNKEEEITSSLRFVYQPKESYILYTNSPTGRESVPLPPIDLFSKKLEAVVTLGTVRANTLYKERDSDGDSVIDSTDNCPMYSNADQKDGNNNGIGDACDDYDYDGVMTAVDNCPMVVNPNQSDIDRDGIGDTCDQEESRITEKHTWIPWVVFVGVFIAVLGMGYQVIRMKSKKEGMEVKEGE